MTIMSKECLKQIRLDAEVLSEREALAEIMKKELDLPQSFSGNLDALSDFLSEVVEDTVFEAEASYADSLDPKSYAAKALRVISDAAQENPHLHLYLMA